MDKVKSYEYLWDVTWTSVLHWNALNLWTSPFTLAQL